MYRHFRLLTFFYLLFAAHANAYDIRTDGQGNFLHWGDSLMPIPYFIDRRECSDISDGSEIAAIQSAFQTWEHVASGNIAFQFEGLIESGDVNPEASVVMWVKEEWSYDSCYVAMTRLYYDRADARILKVEIMLNGRDYRWSTNGEAGTLDVQNVTTHEVGHFIGLGDVQSTGRTMFEYILLEEKSKRDLADDDINGLRAVYPGISREGELIIREYSLDYASRNIRPVERSYFALNNEAFVGLCPLSDTCLPQPCLGAILVHDGAVTLSVMGGDGTVARELAIRCPYAINPGRIRAISSLYCGNASPHIAALAATSSGPEVLIGAVPHCADEWNSIVLSSVPVEGADDLLAFAPLGPAEGSAGNIIVLAEKRRNRDYYISLALARGDNGELVTLMPLSSWQIPDCTSILGLATGERRSMNREIAVLLRNGLGETELAVYAAPFDAAPESGETLEPTHRLDAEPIASEGRVIAVSSILSNDSGGLRNLSVILAR